MDHSQLSPGVRIEARDAQWVIRCVDRTSTGGYKLTVQGISEIVRDQERVFLTEVEERFKQKIAIVDPAKTEFAIDDSPNFRKTRLFLEAKLRQAAPSGEGIFVGHKAAMNLESYQLEPAQMALSQLRQRILIADAVGLGKTLEAGVLVSELIRRGRGRRILVLAVKSMLTQFQKEFWSRFTIPLVRLDSAGIERIRQDIPSNQNPFHSFDRTIISIDTLKQDARYRAWLEQAHWDIIVIDEAHNVAERGSFSKSSLRARLARLLADRSDSLIMLSATPHDGKARSFASLMNMLNPTAIANEQDYSEKDIKSMFIRRFRKDLDQKTSTNFRQRHISKIKAEASSLEEEVFSELKALQFQNLDKNKRPSHLLRVILEKALLSSPVACSKTLENKIQKLQKQGLSNLGQSLVAEIENLQDFKEKVDRLEDGSFSKVQRLLTLLKDWKWKGRDPKDRLVIFTERIETLFYLESRLTRDLKLKEKSVRILHGAMSDKDQQEVVEDFGNGSSDVRLLIASDVASEGINLHYFCHRLIHFDIPWSLMVFQQRNGRIDRYGQESDPEIAYLLTRFESEILRGDLRILELLIEKDQQVQDNIGDPRVFTKVDDVESEEEIVKDIIGSGKGVAELEEKLKPEKAWDPWETLKASVKTESKPASISQAHSEPTRLFTSEFEYFHQSLKKLAQGREAFQFEAFPQEEEIHITLNHSLRRLFRKLPREVMPPVEDRRIFLTSSIKKMNEAIEDSRSKAKTWSKWQYLWELNPILAWATDRNLNLFSRNQAPLVPTPSLSQDEVIFLFNGVFPNRRAQPLIQQWFGLSFKGTGSAHQLELDEVFQKTGLKDAKLPNRGGKLDTSRIQTLLHRAVVQAQAFMSEKRRDSEDHLNPRLQDELNLLEDLKRAHLQTLAEKSTQAKFSEFRRQEEENRIERIFDHFLDWVESSMSVGSQPCIQVIAAFQGV
jgi:superfamily II DNA/RNA helicase